MKQEIKLYKSLLRIRLVEEAIAHRYSEQKMRCPTHLSIGQEAVAVGVSAMLSKTDKVFSSHRAHAHYLAKGGCLDKLIAELYGKETGCTGGRGGSMHLSDLGAGFVASTAIVANSIPLAAGYALHQQTNNLEDVSVSYFGDGAVEEGAFYETANFAVLRKLPLLMICENNQYSVYSRKDVRQPKGRSISQLAQNIGLAVLEADGNDVTKVIETARQATDYIRQGKGPFFIEYHTYRHREHCGPNWDDELGYRPHEEVNMWLQNDPVLLFEEQLDGFSEELKNELIDEINGEIAVAFNKAEKAPFPQINSISDFVYA